MTLALRFLKLADFRSYARADLEIAPGVIALAGPNGAGKTNILEAVSLLAPGRGLRRAAPADLTRHGQAGWSVSALLDTGTDPTELWTGAEADGRRTARRDGKAASVISLGRVARILWLTPALDRVFVEGPGERRRFLDRIALTFAPEHAEHAARYERAMRERNRLLKDGATDPAWLGGLEAQMAAAGVALAAGRGSALSALLAAQQGVTTGFPIADASLTGEFAEAAPDEDGFRDRLAAGRPADSLAGRTLIGPHRDDLAVRYSAKDVPAAECSTGEQKALLVSLVLANARALAAQTGAPPILLLDEIAAHFDADRRSQLFAEIDALGAQAWLTGTEWALFEALGTNAQRIAVSEREDGSRIGPP